MAVKKKKASAEDAGRMAAETQAQNAAQTQGAAQAMLTVAYNAPRGIVFSVNGREIAINGNAAHLAGREKGILPVGRYGYTRVAAEDWEAIERSYGGMAIFRSGLIFAERSRERAEDRAEEQAETRHGLEPVNSDAAATVEAAAPGL